MNVGNTCQHDNCNKKHHAKGYCSAHYQQLIKYGEIKIAPRKSNYGEGLQWLFNHIWYDDKINCLTWPYVIDRHGRGRVSYNGRQWQAHRLMCVLAKGKPPFEKAEATHTCGKGHEACINPNHLVWKDHLENMLDRVVHNTLAKGSRQGHSKLTERDAFEIRQLRGYYSGVELSKLYGVSTSIISSIHNNKIWV